MSTASTPKCARCGQPLDPNYWYCRNCGLTRDGKQMPVMPEAGGWCRQGHQEIYFTGISCPICKEKT